MNIYKIVLRWIGLAPTRIDRFEMGQAVFDALQGGAASPVEELVRAARGDYLTGIPILVRGEERSWRALAADGSVVAHGALR